MVRVSGRVIIIVMAVLAAMVLMISAPALVYAGTGGGSGLEICPLKCINSDLEKTGERSLDIVRIKGEPGCTVFISVKSGDQTFLNNIPLTILQDDADEAAGSCVFTIDGRTADMVYDQGNDPEIMIYESRESAEPIWSGHVYLVFAELGSVGGTVTIGAYAEGADVIPDEYIQKDGVWYHLISDEPAGEDDLTFLYEVFDGVPPSSGDAETVSFTVTFKVENGAWDDGTKDDKTVILSRRADEDKVLTLTEADIPGVGDKPDENYKQGSWDKVPITDRAISQDTVFTYKYTKSEFVETVFVNGTELKADGDSVEDDNKEGTATLNYDAMGDPVLTLDSFNCQINIYQGSAIGYHGNKELTIILKGESSLTNTDNTRCGIQTDHSLKIKGSGTLSLSCSEKLSSYSGIESGSGDITIDDNCNVTVHGKSKDYSYGLFAREGSVNVNSGCISLIMTNASENCFGIRAGEHVVIGDNITKVEASGDPAISGTVINKVAGKGWDGDKSQSSDIKISNSGQALTYKNDLFEAEQYDLWVGGTHVTSANDDDIKDSVIKSGSVCFDHKSRTLTLKNAAISGEGQDLIASIHTKYKYLTVSLEGDNTIRDNEETIFVDNNDAGCTLTFTGNGTLNASGTNNSIKAVTVVIDGECSLTASGSIKAVDGKVMNAGPGRGWTNEAGTGDAVSIAPTTTAADLSNYKKILFLKGRGKDNWKFKEFSWTGSATAGYSAAGAVYTYKPDNKYTETVDASSFTNKVVSPTCTSGGCTRYTASVSTADSLDESEHSESMDAKPTPALGHDLPEQYDTDAEEHWKTCKRCGQHVNEGAHIWDDGIVTKEPTYTSDGVLTYTCTICGMTQTESIPKLKVTGTPLAQMKSSGKTSLVLTWMKTTGAEGYDIYFAKNGKKLKKAATVSSRKKLKWTKKKLKKSAAYKCCVKAWLMKDGVKTYVKTSPTVYAYTNKGTKKYTNPKSVAVKETKFKLTVGTTAKIKAKVTKLQKSKKLRKFTRNPRYLSSDPAVATVNKSGKITAKSAGTCKIYAYATNGVKKTITVRSTR